MKAPMKIMGEQAKKGIDELRAKNLFSINKTKVKSQKR